MDGQVAAKLAAQRAENRFYPMEEWAGKSTDKKGGGDQEKLFPEFYTNFLKVII